MKKTFNIIALVLNSVLLFLAILLILQSFLNLETGSFGIIGGEDGPTAIFLSNKVNHLFDALLLILLSIISFFEFVFIMNIRNAN